MKPYTTCHFPARSFWTSSATKSLYSSAAPPPHRFQRPRTPLNDHHAVYVSCRHQDRSQSTCCQEDEGKASQIIKPDGQAPEECVATVSSSVTSGVVNGKLPITKCKLTTTKHAENVVFLKPRLTTVFTPTRPKCLANTRE